MSESASEEAKPGSWAESLREMFARWVGWSHDHYAIVLTVVLLVTCAAAVFAVKLLQDVRTDFATLLPDDDRSVQDLKTLAERYGGSTSVYLMVQSPDFNANRQFVDQLVARLQQVKDEWKFREIRYREGPERAFIEEHKFLYVDLEDLEEIEERLRDRIRWEKCAKSPFCIQLDEKPDFSLDDIEQKYQRNIGASDARNLKGYFSNFDGSIVGIDVDVAIERGQLTYAKKLHQWIPQLVQEIGPEKFHPDLKVSIWGSLTKRLYEYRVIIDEAVRTAGVTAFLVFLVVYIYFRRVRPVLFMGISVMVAIIWTFAITYFHIGYLNQQTAFLGSIIVGNGVNFSLIFMARYLEERHRGLGPREALVVAARNTGGATSTAALATAIAYGVLLFARFKGFSQFGFMGGIGMLLCWIFTFALCPALLALSEKIRPFVPKANAKSLSAGRFGSEGIAEFVEDTPHGIIAMAAALTIGSIFYVGSLLKDPFEYDFSKLGVELFRTEAWNGALAWIEVFPKRQSPPQVILTDSLEQSREVAGALEKKMAEKGSTIVQVSWYGTLIPEHQDEKLEVLKEIKHMAETQPISWLSRSQRRRLEELQDSIKIEPVTVDNVPESLIAKIREKDGTLGRVVLAYPHISYKLTDGRNLIRFSNEVREIDLADGTKVYSSSGGVIFADMLKAIVRDGPLTTTICYFGVIIALFLNFRSFRTTAFLMFFLTYGLLLLGGAMGLLDIKVNFFNFIVIPITVGIGVDYHINIYKRYELDGKKSIADSLRASGGAVLLCSLTTIIGYGMMMLSATKAMVSFGLMAVIGEITCLTSALLLKPAVLVLEERRRASKVQA